ncbi:hypothetical protein KKI22_04020 [Patescibacteria group bacterium]|nr:hypothetical protein [Patescibacteria group bacterium]
MKQALWIAFAVIVLALVVFFGLKILSTKVSDECVRGNQSACVYFEAQEKASQAEKDLQIAKEAYEVSLEATKTSGGE